jgi:hypothetical protein
VYCEWFEEQLGEARQSLAGFKRQQEEEQDLANSPEGACSNQACTV